MRSVTVAGHISAGSRRSTASSLLPTLNPFSLLLSWLRASKKYLFSIANAHWNLFNPGKSIDPYNFTVVRMCRVVPIELDYTRYSPTYTPMTFNGEAKNSASTKFKL